MKNKPQNQMETDLEPIRTRILNVRGKNVMIDKDLAALYNVETKKLNQAVKRNIERFPADFMFQLTKEECLRSQIVTLNEGQGKHLKYMPYAFTELGVAMLSSVLHSQISIQININIMRAFVELREQMNVLSKNALHIENLRLELQNQRAYIEEILRDQNDTNELMQSQLDALSDSMAELSLKMDSITQSESKSRTPIGFAIPRQNSNE